MAPSLPPAREDVDQPQPPDANSNQNHLCLQFEGTSLWHLRLPKLFYIA